MSRRAANIDDAATIASDGEEIPVDAAEAQRRRLLRAADRDNTDRWTYRAARVSAAVASSWIGGETLGDRMDLSATVDTLPVSRGRVPLGFTVDIGDGEDRIDATTDLDPSDAEALAVDLLEQAHAARRAAGSDDV